MVDKATEKRGLGRGLSALMGDVTPVTASSSPGSAGRNVPIEDVSANPNQPRKRFDPDALQDLARSIEEKGIIQPIIVRPTGANRYQIVAGERRWRAAQMAKLHDIPVLVRDLSDDEAMEVAIIENIQRDDLNPVEEAQGYRALMDAHGRTQEEMATALGKSRSHIANTLRLLRLPEEVLDHLRNGRITAGHARALVTAEDPVGLAQKILGKGLSVRQTEQAAKARPPERRAADNRRSKGADTRLVEGELSAALGMRVSLEPNADGTSGRIAIPYRTLDELDDICRVLSSVRGGTI